MTITWELITGLILSSGGVAALAAFMKATLGNRGSRAKAEAAWHAAQDELAAAKAQLQQVRASVPQPGDGLPAADGSMTYCEWHDDLVPLADMVWANWGSEYVCKDCATRHDMEVPPPPKVEPPTVNFEKIEDGSLHAHIPWIASTPRTGVGGNGGKTVMVKGQPIPGFYLPVAAGLHVDGEPWVLFGSEKGAREWAEKHTAGQKTWSIRRENQHWRVDIGQVAVSESLRAVDPDSLAGQTMAKAGGWVAPSDQHYELHTDDENWAMEQELRASAGIPGVMVGVAEMQLHERHLDNCRNMHQVDGAGRVLRCIKPGPESRVFDTDGKATGPVRPTGGVAVRKHPGDCDGKHVLNELGVIIKCKGPCGRSHLVDGNGWMRACGRKGCVSEADTDLHRCRCGLGDVKCLNQNAICPGDLHDWGRSRDVTG